MTGSAAPSYHHGTSLSPLRGLTVGGLLDAARDSWPSALALSVPHQDLRWTWRELSAAVDELAAGFVALGLEPGERVGILAPNIAEWIVVQFATARAGLILVNINPAYRLNELRFALTTAGCRALVTAAAFKTSDYVAMLTELCPELPGAEPGRLDAAACPDLEMVIAIDDAARPGLLNLPAVAAMADDEHRARAAMIASRLDFDDPINIQFTSGTTGTPKAATLSHHSIVNNAAISAAVMGLTEADRLCIPVPMYHCFGMVLGSLLCTACGAAMVLPSAGFDADAMLDAVESEGCTAVHGVPTMFIAALEAQQARRRRLNSLRTGIMAGAPCPEELMHRVMSELNIGEITIAYGMTETGPLSTQTLPADPVALRVATVGRVLPHTEIKIVDPAGHIVPAGTAGELCTRGYCVMRGYWNDPERTAKEIDAAGWIKSGDVATLDEHGYVRIVGRIKDMLIRGGENIYPREIEEFLYTHPDIEQVEVFGVPDARYGEEVAAWIRLKPGAAADAEAIRDFCRGNLAHFKIPRHVRFVTEFPMTVTGKVQKYLMRERMAAELEAERVEGRS